MKERFLGFTPLKDLIAIALFSLIKVVIRKYKIDIITFVAQKYAGANVMRGLINGVHALYKKKFLRQFIPT